VGAVLTCKSSATSSAKSYKNTSTEIIGVLEMAKACVISQAINKLRG